jgi:PAS domain S-box-containing protein
MPDAPPKILVVDDNPATLYATSRVLRAAGFNTIEAECGLKAVDAASRGVDVVVLDINLPDIDGFEVCRRIRLHDGLARTPVIHLSATFVKDIDKVTGLEAGADGYLTHPVEPPVLIATVNAFLRTRRAEEAMRRSEARYRAVFDNALNGILLIDKDSTYLEVNPAMCRILGRTRDQIIGKKSDEFIPDQFKTQAAEINAAIEQNGSWSGTFPMLGSEDRLIYLDWSVARYSIPGTRLGIVSDATERLAAEQQRQELLGSERAARTEAEKANRV